MAPFSYVLVAALALAGALCGSPVTAATPEDDRLSELENELVMSGTTVDETFHHFFELGVFAKFLGIPQSSASDALDDLFGQKSCQNELGSFEEAFPKPSGFDGSTPSVKDVITKVEGFVENVVQRRFPDFSTQCRTAVFRFHRVARINLESEAKLMSRALLNARGQHIADYCRIYIEDECGSELAMSDVQAIFTVELDDHVDTSSVVAVAEDTNTNPGWTPSFPSEVPGSAPAGAAPEEVDPLFPAYPEGTIDEESPSETAEDTAASEQTDESPALTDKKSMGRVLFPKPHGSRHEEVRQGDAPHEEGFEPRPKPHIPVRGPGNRHREERGLRHSHDHHRKWHHDDDDDDDGNDQGRVVRCLAHNAGEWLEHECHDKDDKHENHCAEITLDYAGLLVWAFDREYITRDEVNEDIKDQLENKPDFLLNLLSASRGLFPEEGYTMPSLSELREFLQGPVQHFLTAAILISIGSLLLCLACCGCCARCCLRRSPAPETPEERPRRFRTAFRGFAKRMHNFFTRRHRGYAPVNEAEAEETAVPVGTVVPPGQAWGTVIGSAPQLVGDYAERPSNNAHNDYPTLN